MTTNQKIDGVPGLRSLIERVTSQDLGMSAKKDRAEAAHELRALLDEPANRCGECGAETVQGCNDRGCFFFESGNGEPAAQPQGEGEPVIHITPEALSMLRGERKMQSGGLTYSQSKPVGGWTVPLYAEKTAPVAQKYDDTLLPFVALMRKELHANAGKGDRPGWLEMSSDTCLLEIIYHFGKLQASVKRGDEDGIREYGADVANMCMMLSDICGLLETK